MSLSIALSAYRNLYFLLVLKIIVRWLRFCLGTQH